MDTLPMSLWLDLLGTFVFGLSGGMLAVRRNLDLFGIAVLAGAAALFGGVIRDVTLGATPPAALSDSRYVLAALAAAALAFFAHPLIDWVAKPVMVLDAMGLGLFAVVGCRKALDLGVGPLPAMLLGVVSAVGGGVIRDLLVTEVPRVLREEIYALAAMLGAGIVVLGQLLDLPQGPTALAAATLTALFRMVSVWRGWHLPRAGS
ncbi:trimeric intracellular cation channel family protein [Maritimibacter sp. DP1N21-5]|uniref:trimeric intracellular cation channel family protein n=1 Tax=Maritimibacter sp. DP1N21-5 TaxID=2836867 RepID=UPI001C472253|nr:TRIC cation channel family protein [Maritimibacter sp. DP1N21-5]MBV7407437.1 TRIC cation channel family protein [Maritimibacter sp. DP1N21-5]